MSTKSGVAGAANVSAGADAFVVMHPAAAALAAAPRESCRNCRRRSRDVIGDAHRRLPHGRGSYRLRTQGSLLATCAASTKSCHFVRAQLSIGATGSTGVWTAVVLGCSAVLAATTRGCTA